MTWKQPYVKVMKNGNDLIHQTPSNLFISVRIKTKVITKSKRLEVVI